MLFGKKGSNILLFFLFCASLFFFYSFNKKVKKDLVWFNNSDQNAWVIYSSFDFNDGEPSKYISHPGVGTSFLVGGGYKLLSSLGLVGFAKTSDLKSAADPIVHLPDIYKKAGYLSVLFVALCALLIGGIVYVITNRQFIYGAYSSILALFSGGFLFHSVMLRNELSAIFYFLISLFLFTLVFYRQTKNHFYDWLLLIIAGFFFGLSYFSKSQIVLATVLFFVFAFYAHWTSKIFYHPNQWTPALVLLGHLLLGGYLWNSLDRDLPFFWMGIVGLFITFSIVSIIGKAYKENQITSFASLLSEYGLGFIAGIIYTLERGLKGELKASKRVLDFTSLYNPDATSIQAKTIDGDFTSILERFYYFLQHYFLESILLVVLVFSLYLLFKRDKNGIAYLLAILLIVAACFLNSMRANLSVNIARAVFKYMIFMDIAAVLLCTYCYFDIVARSQKKNLIHILFWIMLVGVGAINYHKVKSEVNWTWTTFADMVYPERWLYPGDPPVLRKVFREKYKGFVNGHDRVVFGDELERTGTITVPGGENHLKRIHKLSMEPYWNRMRIMLDLGEKDKENIDNTEKRILQFKIRSFKEGDDYKTIVEKTTKKRKFLYSKILDRPVYLKFIKIIEENRLTVPF